MLKEKNHQKKLNSKTYQTLIPPYIWRAMKIEQPIPEYKFTIERQWRIDYAWPESKLAVEIEGGVFVKGRHVRPMGYINDMEKYNKLNELGWCLLRYIPRAINYDQISRVLDKRNNNDF